MTKYLIIGCGRFGNRAATQLIERHPKAEITVVDKNRTSFNKISHLPVETVICNGQSFLLPVLLDGKPVDYIIPAIPYHLAFELILSQLKPFGAKRTKIPPLHGLPNPMMGKTGDLYTSLADFLCPDNCPEPSHHCTVTGKKRSRPLFKVLLDLKGPFESMVIRSHQLGLGIGGFQPEELIDLTGRIKKRMGSNCLFLISTACRCHGVISALSI